MDKEFGYIKKNKLIAFVGNLDNKNRLSLTDNIVLRETNDKEKENFLKYHKINDMKYREVNHCFEFIITDKFIKEEIESEELDIEDLEIDILFEAMVQLFRMEESINICKKHPCEILRIDLITEDEYIPDYTDEFLLRGPKVKYFGDVSSTIKEEDIETINSIFSVLLELNRNDYKKYWWMIPIDYYNKHAESEFIANQIIDLITGLESLLSYEKMEISYRLKLRSSLYLYHIDSYFPPQVQQVIKEMYNLRSDIIHGTVNLIEPELGEITYIPGKNKTPPVKISVDVATRMLKSIFRLMLLDTLLNHTEKSKKEFIDFIDSIWYQDIDESKINLIDNYEIVISLKDNKEE